MPSFRYKEVDASGTTAIGTVVAGSKQEVVRLIREKGKRPIMIQELEEKSKDIKELGIFNKKPNLKDIAIFCKQLNIMLAAGMPIINALEVLGAQTENRRLREALIDISFDVQKGTVFSKSMTKYDDIFPPLMINMVVAGELTGKLDDVLGKLAVHYEKEYKINNKMKSAMIYPAVLAVVSVVVVTFILVKVMPMFTDMFTSAGVELPITTRILVTISEFLQKRWYIVLIFFVISIFFGRSYIKSENGKRNWDIFLLRIPKISKYIAIIATARFTRTMSTLLSSGIPIIQAMESAGKVTNNTVIMDSMGGAVEDVKKGETLSSVLRRIEIFPTMMTSMIHIGEESGSIEDMLSKTADFYDEEFETAIARMVAMVEPAMIIVMGTIVGFIVISIMMPMFEMSNVVGG
ncbi:MAG: type II secretion system F family protein [Peptostreptococcaceae bacterium]|nr:type II secretion system F family protein [Peptostreptococcaceae bacterium]